LQTSMCRTRGQAWSLASRIRVGLVALETKSGRS